VDQGSANGTFLDSHRVTDALLRAGQELRIGSVGLRVEISGDEPSGEPTGYEATLLTSAPVVPPPPEAPKAVPTRAPPPPPSPPPGPPPLRSPVPSMGGGGPPPRKGRGPLFWIAGGCLGCLTMVVLFLALVGGGLYFWARGPVDTVQEEIALLHDGKVDAAYAKLGRDLKARLSLERFERTIASHPALRAGGKLEVWPPRGSVQVVNDRGHVAGVLVLPSGERESLSFELAKEAGEWRIVGIEIGGRDAASGPP
ncbi:MAG TPA: FHA domain-containing protein, partial [Vicinamibacteria bacterium]